MRMTLSTTPPLRVCRSKCRQIRRLQTRPPICLHFPETLVLNPMLPRFHHLLPGSCNEVPPHDDTFRKRFTADHQNTRIVSGCKVQFISSGAEIMQGIAVNPPSPKLNVAMQNKERVLEFRL